jgi:hypothetical protein
MGTSSDQNLRCSIKKLENVVHNLRFQGSEIHFQFSISNNAGIYILAWVYRRNQTATSRLRLQ